MAAKSVTVEMEQNLVMLLVDAASVKTMWRSVYQIQKLKQHEVVQKHHMILECFHISMLFKCNSNIVPASNLFINILNIKL